jgi:hypothetical protein
MESGSAKDRRKKRRREGKRLPVISSSSHVAEGPDGRKKLIMIIEIISFIITIGTLTWGVFTYLKPCLTVVLGDQLDPDDSLSYRFTLKNDGNVELSNLAVGCLFITAVDKRGSKLFNTSSSLLPNARSLKSGEPTTVRCSSFYGLNLENADIQLIIRYKYFWSILKGTKRSRFDVVMGNDGRLHWEPKPPVLESKQLDKLLNKLANQGFI